MKLTRIALAVATICVVAVMSAVGWVGYSIIEEWRGEAAYAPRRQQWVEVTLSPTTKLKLQLPSKWLGRVNAGPGGGQSVDLITVSPPNGLAGHLSFTPALNDYVTQADMNDLLRHEYANGTKDSREKQVNIVEMKSKTGVGAYAVFTSDVAIVGGAPFYAKEGDGLFVTHGVLIKFDLVGADDLPDVTNMIEQGVTAE